MYILYYHIDILTDLPKSDPFTPRVAKDVTRSNATNLRPPLMMMGCLVIAFLSDGYILDSALDSRRVASAVD